MFKKLLSLVSLALVISVAVHAGDYPRKNVTVIVPYGAGGTTDTCVRTMLDSVDPAAVPSGVSFVVSNVSGGSGMIGTNKFVNSRKDGYTIGVINCDFLLSSVRGTTKLTLDDFVPLAFVQVDPYLLLVSADAPYKTLEEFVAFIRANPGKVKFGDTGPAAVPNFASIAFRKALGLDIKTVSYDTSTESTLAVIRGEIEATIAHTTSCIGQLEAGAVIPLAVTSNVRSDNFPNVPAIGEVFPDEASDMRVLCWIASAALPGMDESQIDYLRTIFGNAVTSDVFKEKQKRFHMDEVTMTTKEDMFAFFEEQAAYYKKNLD